MKEIQDMMLQLMQELRDLKAVVEQNPTRGLEQFKKEWLDGYDVIQTLHLSKRTLQSLRDTGALPYSRINGKFYYKLSDIEEMLRKNYQEARARSFDDK